MPQLRPAERGLLSAFGLPVLFLLISSVQAQDLLVSSRDTDSILRYDGQTGAFAGVFASSTDLDDPYGVITGPDGKVYVSNTNKNSVLRYDAQTGQLLNVFIAAGSGGLHWPVGLVFGADGNLYVGSWYTNNVLRYDGATGSFIDVFASGGGLRKPHGIAFGPDGNLYVGSWESGDVLRYNGSTGAFMDVFVSQGAGGLISPRGLTFGPDGNLYVSAPNADAILRYNGATGSFMDAFVATQSGGLDGPMGLVFGPGGDLYVSGQYSDNVLRYDGTTGAFLGAFAPTGSGGLSGPTYLAFLQEPLNVRVSAHIEPATPATLDDLDCVTTLENVGGYPDLSWAYRWFRDGDLLEEGLEVEGVSFLVDGATLSHHFTSKNETFFCAARVTDGTAWLETLTEPVTILNTPPTAPVYDVLPENPTPKDGLAVWIVEESEDIDGDTIFYLFEWYESSDGLDWHRRPELSGSPPYSWGESAVADLYTQAADYWRVDVTPVEVDLGAKPGLSSLPLAGRGLQDFVRGDKWSYTFYVLPDLNGDGRVDASDVIFLQSVWHQRKADLAPDVQKLFFDSGDADAERIGCARLFQIASKGWYRSRKE